MSFNRSEAQCKSPNPNLLLRLLSYIQDVKSEPGVGLAFLRLPGFDGHETKLALARCMRNRLLETDRLSGLSDKGLGYLVGLLASLGR